MAAACCAPLQEVHEEEQQQQMMMTSVSGGGGGSRRAGSVFASPLLTDSVSGGHKRGGTNEPAVEHDHPLTEHEAVSEGGG